MKNILYSISILLLTQNLAFAQIDTSKTYSLDSVYVKVGRLENPLLTEPKSITSIQISKVQNARQQVSVNEYLMEVPGLFALNPNNFAQDLRVSIRGFGARSAFGIRGVKILVDGIPETTPDGQGQTDNLDLGLIENIEILRGPSSGLYGNASGGVISISTQSEVTKNFLEAGLTFGSFGLQRYQLKGGIKSGATTLVLNGSYNQLDGFRQNSGVQHATISANLNHQFSKKTKLKFIFNYTDSPKAEDPGGVNLASVESNRKAARDRNILFQSGEKISQLKLATVLESGNFQTKFFYINRDFYGKLPFGFGGIVDLNRNFFGHGSTYNFKNYNNQFSNNLIVGYDLQFQQDDRQQFRNEEGTQGDLTFHQKENFTNLGLFLTDNLKIKKWNLNGSLRYDLNRLSANDLELGNGDDSGEINFNALNGGVGVSYNLNQKFNPFTRFSTSFETPTLSELSANPIGVEGFNENLKPQQAVNFEIGVKGLINSRLQYEVAAFQIQTTNEILSFELEQLPDRDFFRNAGKTLRNGFEAAVKYSPKKSWQFAGNYSFSDFRFKDYATGGTVFDDQKLPGIPIHSGAISIRYISQKGAFFKLTGLQVGKLFANDTNTVEVENYTLLNFNLGYELEMKKMKWIPFFGVNNLLNSKYNDNIRINAFGSRFYEPAAGINVFGGVRVRIR